ncbi:MAG: nucleoside triphosphate pyrophosphohydrolase [Pseudomonadota bacterium]
MPEQQEVEIIHDPDGGIERLREIMRRLRAPVGGCPWDIEQTFETIAPYTIEEAYEVADAIERADLDDLREELGDLLLQVVYHAQMASEQRAFTFDDVVNDISDKMVRRHPHVFAGAENADWEQIKRAEKAVKGRKTSSVLDDVPLPLPALTRAEKLQKRAAQVGFDWPEVLQVLDKLHEEAQELTEAHAAGSDPDAVEEEMGDLLFVVANLARHMNVDPEKSLRRANSKFIRRFQAIEAALEEQGRSPSDSTLEEMDRLWDQAKEHEKRS